MLVLVNYTPQATTFYCRNWGQERLLIVATIWCLFLFQWMAKLWPEGPFMKVGRLVFTSILRTKCNLTSSGILSRILMELSESVSQFSLPAAHSALLTGAGNPLSSFCSFLKRQEPLCLFHACFTCSEVSQYLGKPWFILCASGQCSPLGKVALGCRESVACPGHFLPDLSAGRKMSADLGKFCFS